MLFDGDTGKPIRKMIEDTGAGRVTPAMPASFPTAPVESGNAETAADAALDGFPIDLEDSN
jgi:hypothetical protein